MSGEQPTGDAGASVTDQIEKLIGHEPEADQGKEVEQEAPEEAEKPAGDAPDEAEGPQYELSDVAKILGLEDTLLDVDEDGSLKIKTKIDGQEGTAKLQDLIKSYQLQGHIDARVRKQAEQEKAHAERVNQIEQFAQTKLQELDALSDAAQKMLAHEAGQVDWDRLALEDPVSYTAERHKFERRHQQTQQFLEAVKQQRQSIEQAQQWKQAQEFQREMQRVPSLIPEWADEKVRNTESAEMRTWLQGKGVSEQSINALRDAGLVAVLRAGMVAERTAPKVAAVEKKVRAAPKLVRPGNPTTAKDREAESVRGLMKQIRDSGGKSGIAEYLIATGKV